MEKIKRIGWQFIKFGMVGASSTVVNSGVYMVSMLVFARLTGIKTNQVSQAGLFCFNFFGYLISTLNGYILQSKFVFKGGEHSAKRMIKVYMGYFPGFLLSAVIIPLLTIVFKFPKLWVQLCTLPITVPFNFVLQKKWAYKE